MTLLQNGSFIVRNSRQAGPNKPYVITILCNRKIFHVPIRRTVDSDYAVGEEKEGELVNRSLPFVKSLFYKPRPIE